SLTLESASPGLKTEEERLQRIKQDETLALEIKEDLASFVRFWESIPLFASHEYLQDDIKKDLREERLMQTPKGLIDSLKGMGTGTQISLWNDLSRLDLPVHLVVGEWDEKFLKINKEMADQIKNVHLTIIKHSGHTPH